MTSPQRLEHDLPALLTDVYVAGIPDYRDDLVQRIAATRQRPAWTFPERWLPMDLVTTRVPTARLPLRELGLLALIAILAAAALAVYAGTQRRLPAPFGPAANGLVVYARAADIVVVDPETGEERPIVSGPEADAAPRFSRDGSRIVFERFVSGPERGSHIMVVAPDGSGLTALTSEPVDLFRSAMAPPYTFSPDGRIVAIAAVGPDRRPDVLVAQADGSGGQWLGLPTKGLQFDAIREPAFRPPDGSQLLLTADRLGGSPFVFTVDVATGEVLQTVVNGAPGSGLDSARWSPDGQRISYATWSNEESGLSVRTHIVAHDGSEDRLLPAPDGMVYDIGTAWSNDGTRIFVVRGFSGEWESSRPAIVPTDGTGLGIEIPYEGPFQGGCCNAWEWSPDDSMILGKPITPSGVPGPQAIIDVDSLSIRQAPWNVSDDPAWQRVAP